MTLRIFPFGECCVKGARKGGRSGTERDNSQPVRGYMHVTHNNTNARLRAEGKEGVGAGTQGVVLHLLFFGEGSYLEHDRIDQALNRTSTSKMKRYNS